MPQIDTKEMLEHVPAVVFRFTHVGNDWKTHYVTESVSMFGYSRDDFMSGRMTWYKMVHPDDRVLLSKTIVDYEKHNVNNFRLYYRLVTKSGSSIPVTEFNTVNRDKDGSILSYDTTIISNNLTLASQKMLDDHSRQQIVLNEILLSLHDADLDNALQIILDRTGEYLDTSRALLFKDNEDHTTCKVVYEWDNQDISSVMALDYSITYSTGMPEIYVALQETGNLIINYGEIPENCKEEFEAEGLIASAIFAVYLNGEHYGFVCFDDCVVERKWDEDTIRFLKNISNLISTTVARQYTAQQLEESQETIKRLAYTDYLTKLSNRFRCDVQLQESMSDATQSGQTGYLLFLDMDDFKIVNDCYGHDYGDEVLISLANWLKESFPAPHQVFRFGGDEFVVLLAPGHVTDLDSILDMLHDRANLPWKAKNKEFYCSLSIGVVAYPGVETDSKAIIKQADIAMYEAKRLGKNRHSIYDVSLDSSSKARTDMEAVLRNAMKDNFHGFELFYQPLVNRVTGKIEAAEVLLRVKNGDEVLLPKDFLPLAEYLGFTIPIGDHVFRTAAQVCKNINDNGFKDFKICVNISFKQLRQKNIVPFIENTIEEIGIDYKNIMLSVSEASALEDPERMKLVCGEFQKKGIDVKLDDFGGASTSFLQLGDIPVDGITTSIKLMENIDQEYARELISLITRLSHSSGKKLCINGIETEEQYKFSVASEADRLQGYYIYNLKTEEELIELLQK